MPFLTHCSYCSLTLSHPYDVVPLKSENILGHHVASTRLRCNEIQAFTFLSSVYSVNDNSHALFRLVKAIDETHMFASRSTIQYGKSSCSVPDEVLNNPSTALPAAVFVVLCWAGRFKAWFKYWPGTRLIIRFSKPCKSLKQWRIIRVPLSNPSTTGCQLIFIAMK